MAKRAWKNAGMRNPFRDKFSESPGADGIILGPNGIQYQPPNWTPWTDGITEQGRAKRPKVPGIDYPRVEPGPNDQLPPGYPPRGNRGGGGPPPNSAEYAQYRPAGMSDDEWDLALYMYNRYVNNPRERDKPIASFADWLARWQTRDFTRYLAKLPGLRGSGGGASDALGLQQSSPWSQSLVRSNF